VKGTVGVDRPEVSSGSDTYPLDVVAAVTEDRKMVTVAVVNPTETVQHMNLDFKGADFGNLFKSYLLAAPDLSTRNIPGEEPAIEIHESELRKIPKKLEVPPISISLYEFELK
jgi:alpha-N-arabinofuranosidase